MFQITLPHSHCIETNTDSRFDKICDISSEEIGRKLHRRLYEKKIPSRVVTSHQNRSHVDDNRKHSMEAITPLHENVLSKINKTLAIVDVHSFYRNAFKVLPQKELHGDPNESCLVIFSLYKMDVNERLYNYLCVEKKHKNLALISSPDIVFILKYYTNELKVPTFMFEFAEFMDVPDALLDDIVLFLEMYLYKPYIERKKTNASR